MPDREAQKRPSSLLPRAVAEARITCTSCPWQAEGRIWDGPWFYFRIRSGHASLGLGASVDEAVKDGTWRGRAVVDREFGGTHDVPWVPTDAEAWALFDVLLAMPQNDQSLQEPPCSVAPLRLRLRRRNDDA